MFDRKVDVGQKELTVGMIVRTRLAWVRIEHIDSADPRSHQRKATCTLRRQTKPGAFTVWFAEGPYKVLANSLPPGFAICARTVASQDEPSPTTHKHVNGGVHNTVTGEVRGALIQTGDIDGQTVTDFFKNG